MILTHGILSRLFSEHCVRSAMRWFIDMENIANTLRLFDLFLSYDHPWMPFYFAAALAMAQHTPRDIISTQELETLINKAIELEHGHNTVVDHSRIDISRVLYDPTLMVVASMALLAMVPSGMSTLRYVIDIAFKSTLNMKTHRHLVIYHPKYSLPFSYKPCTSRKMK